MVRLTTGPANREATRTLRTVTKDVQGADLGHPPRAADASRSRLPHGVVSVGRRTIACAISCGSVPRMSLQVARSTKLTESSTCCIVAPPLGPA